LASFFIMSLSPEIATSISRHSFFIITVYFVWFIVGNGSVSLQLLIPKYGYLAFLTYFYCFWYMLIPMFLDFTRFFAYVEL
jgi:hypothetical protein